MNSLTLRNGLVAAALAGLLVGCERPSAPVPFVARVGEEVITVAQLEKALQAFPRGRTEAEVDAVLEQLIQHRLLVQRAKAKGLERDPAVIAAYENMLVRRFMDDAEKSQPAAVDTVSPVEIERIYAESQTRFTVPARLNAAMIFVEAPESFAQSKRDERRQRIEQARARAVAAPASAGFGPLAAEFSFDQATKHRGGNLGWLVEGEDDARLDPVARPALFALLQPGDTSEIITTPVGYYLFKLIEKQPGTTRPLTEVEGIIRGELLRKKQAETEAAFRASLAQGIPKIRNPELIAQVVKSVAPRQVTSAPPPPQPVP